jgi:hypothetical protein
MELPIYKLEKPIWTDADFARMGWLDCQIWSSYADDLRSEFVLDIDYIFHWQDQCPRTSYYKFWVSTATLVFESVNGVRMQMDSGSGAMEVENRFREEPVTNPTQKQYRFKCGQGELCIQASGYTMYVRQLPQLIEGQYFTFEERGGISFARELQPL